MILEYTTCCLFSFERHNMILFLTFLAIKVFKSKHSIYYKFFSFRKLNHSYIVIGLI